VPLGLGGSRWERDSSRRTSSSLGFRGRTGRLTELVCTVTPFFFFFVYSYSHVTYIDHGGIHFARFSRPQSARGGSLQAPLVPSARPSRKRLLRTKEMDKGKRQKETPPDPYSSPADAMKGGVGRNSGSSPAPSASASNLRSSSRSRCSRSSHSDASLPASASSSAGGTILPTSVAVRKSSIV